MPSNKDIVLIFSVVRAAFMSSHENIVLIFSLITIFTFTFFCFSIYKVVDSKCSTVDCKSSKIGIGTIMKNPEMLSLVAALLKIEKLCKHQLKNVFRSKICC